MEPLKIRIETTDPETLQIKLRRMFYRSGLTAVIKVEELKSASGHVSNIYRLEITKLEEQDETN